MSEHYDPRELDKETRYTKRRGPALLLTIVSTVAMLALFGYIGFAIFA